MTVGIVGAHSTGKTTFLAQLASALRRQDVQVATVADLGEQAQHHGLPILHAHTWTSTFWIVTRGISNELGTWPHTEVVLVDRAVPDALGYYRAALAYRDEQADPHLTSQLETLVRNHSRHYDLLLRSELDDTIPLGTAKPRDQDQRFRQLADHHVARVLTDLELPHQLLPSGDREEALKRTVEYVTGRL
ncbi:AAA family ATPase [Amycolatopsis suaedae]|uniref:AAA family ATPase n=1 Tax=Amycolatopsis suaedae TaxID=2510978 RepID=UPI0013EF5130|nr:AAA family ATPase [Amycolatopsis suaedae]